MPRSVFQERWFWLGQSSDKERNMKSTCRIALEKNPLNMFLFASYKLSIEIFWEDFWEEGTIQKGPGKVLTSEGLHGICLPIELLSLEAIDVSYVRQCIIL